MTHEARKSLPFLIFEEVQDAEPYAGALFRRKFGDPIPNFPHHYVALYKAADGALHVLGYSHAMVVQGIGLGGGSCTDMRVMRMMTAAERAAVRDAGGMLFLLLHFGFERFAQETPVVFAYCGDRRAEMVDLRAGFEKTEYSFLLRRTLRPLSDEQVAAFTRQAAAIGPF
jgi:hypothetical protein